ncbi:RagB/SusD family nutrient uptake outer membrane protein [Pedobacter sp. AW31-3R]|uniref:RagB/SusD family nutrient uptake outer membrane protein n=1 Tax=Pedobacter sp. AW31-3R TaxID=3445781 RepID=UPI003F9EE9F8
MKKYTIFLIFIIALTLSSCKKDFLNIIPQGKQVASTTEDYRKLLNNKRFYVYDYSGGWQGQVLMGDDVAAEGGLYNSATPVTQKAFSWVDDIFQSGEIDWTQQLWLENLYTLNKIINEAPESVGGTEQQKAVVIAEAQATRAWLYFQFVNFFGKSYQKASAETDLAFPIITTADVTIRSYSRATVQQVYDFIETDFKQAITVLPITSESAVHFNRAAAKGLLGKVYLFTGRYTEALQMFNESFSDNSSSAVPARLYDYNKEFATGGKFDPVTTSGPSNSPGINYLDFTESLVAKSFYNSSYNGNGYGNDCIVLSSKTRMLFDPADLRLKFYAAQFPYQQQNPSGRLSKIGVSYSKFGLQISELYLLRAECKARLNDLNGAITDLQILRDSRLPSSVANIPSAVAASQSSMLSFIFDEREREFAAEGYRWFDMRREASDPLFPAKTYIHTVYNEDGVQASYTLKSERLTMRLPYYLIVSNPEMPNNP